MYYIICIIAPPPGKPYVKELFGNEYNDVIDGQVESGGETSSDHEKFGIASSLKNVER